MLRGKTARTVLTVLAAVLLALQLFAPTATFASAHTFHVSSTESDAEFITCGKSAHSNGPAGPLRTLDRNRVVDHVPQTPARALLCKDPAGHHEDPSHIAAAPSHHRTTRSSAAHATAALQVFRC
ncbi:hypothetical protein [Streptomyces sp. NPDC050704]|uniref:hypothetical protein n=1 Tax=Streptomyces sp. NPDC050704 TaxID=3157219 RepID=UPI00341BED09